MFVSKFRPSPTPWTGGAIVPGSSIVEWEASRALHARLLEIAAARRMRAADRRRSARQEDADYWLACAPAALRRAISVRRGVGLSPLP